MKWNWQHARWPQFTYDQRSMQLLENQLLQQAGVLLGSLNYLNDDEKKHFTVDLMGDEAYHTSEIEGEILNRDSLRSSIARHLGLIRSSQKIPAAEEGIASLMLKLVADFSTPLSNDILFLWHLMLLPMQWRIKIGTYRTHSEAMQVVSGSIHKPIIHFEAPPSKQVPKEMRQFIKWFNESAPQGKNPLPALARAAIAHLYFITIHPFEDGNGRIARALAQKVLMQTLNHPVFITLSHIIQKNKKQYYAQLQKTNRDLNISEWMNYFAHTILEAQHYTQKLISFLINKARFYDRLRGQLNARQEKVLARLFAEGLEGFAGGLSAKNYMRIAKTSASTATRDLADLVHKKALRQTGELKYTRYFLLDV
ncbi:MAG: hypothetical protein ACD_42C00408G0009 [uncultured bacterium]|nr:MAG: hypothetical protein ACD_42C00408G0009 [uncultured bacterium]OGT32875.1 MAG: cell filamentation protein Fic [Gammaproteobacteria bacterium RIFCSPHIGHO2_02_FULL_39_13]OGT50533.1 MAG: cell filamentation protein Fic [Gammaproteobacteria bacterium RIFCSPHIGHO2_12_FULL_39_24]